MLIERDINEDTAFPLPHLLAPVSHTPYFFLAGAGFLTALGALGGGNIWFMMLITRRCSSSEIPRSSTTSSTEGNGVMIRIGLESMEQKYTFYQRRLQGFPLTRAARDLERCARLLHRLQADIGINCQERSRILNPLQRTR